MPARIVAIALNTYREAVRARVLWGLFALALATSAYAVIVAEMSLHNELRVVADLGAASISLYSVLFAVVFGSASLQRELELKTIFPILSRPIRRWEYLLGKYFGTMLTVAVFVAIDGAAVLALLALESGQSPARVGAVATAMLAVVGVALLRAKHARVFTLLPWSPVLALGMWIVAAPAGPERQLVVAAATLTIFEVAIVAGVTMLFSSFSSPFLTAAFTVMVFLIGRSADTLAHLPKKVFGEAVASSGRALAHVFPNLHAYVPPRALLLGQTATPVWPYVATSAIHAIAYATALLVVSALVFRKRDFP